MEFEQVEVYSSQSNFGIVRMPERNYPGCVIQGDSLAILCRMVQNIANFTRDMNIEDEDFLGDVQELNNSLVGRLLHYQSVLATNGINLPYGHSFTEEDIVELLPDSDD
jgi:hypothetical protein